MKKWILHIVLLSVLGMLAASCSQEVDELTTEISEGEVQVMFTIALDGNDSFSRATTWEGYDDDNTDDNTDAEIGKGIENDIDNLRVLLFSNSNDNKYLGEVTPMAYYQENETIYKFIGTVSVTSAAISEGKLNCKIMVLANHDITTNLTINSSNIASLANEVFSRSTNANTLLNIPMWGILNVTTSDNVIMTPGVRTELPNIYLLRAMAKVEVIMMDKKNNSQDFHTISNIQLIGYNSDGYLLPNGYNTTNTTSLPYGGSNGVFHPTIGNSVKADGFIAMSNFISTTKKIDNVSYPCFTLYVPEYANLNEGKEIQTASKIVLQLNGDINKTYTIKFGASGAGTHYDIVRNHIYRFNITEVKEELPLALTLTVNKWKDSSSEVDYKLEAGTSGEGKIGWAQGTFLDTNTKEVLLDGYTGDGTARPKNATFTFNLTSPQNGTWYAKLIYESTDTEAFTLAKVVDGTAGTPSKQVSGTIDGMPVTLQVAAVKDISSLTENNRARLQITVVTPDQSRTIDATELLSTSGGEDEKEYYTILQSMK